MALYVIIKERLYGLVMLLVGRAVCLGVYSTGICRGSGISLLVISSMNNGAPPITSAGCVPTEEVSICSLFISFQD